MRRALVLALLALSLVASAASAAARSVPRGWLGVVADGPMTVPGADTAADWDRLASAGAESVRTAFYWPAVQPSRDAPPDLAHLDSVVLAAAARHEPVLPIVSGTPGWAGRVRGDETSPPRDPRTYAGFLRTLVARYGPAGSLWAEHPEVPRTPIRAWQIWNEPNLTRYWTPPKGQGFAHGYVRLLKVARKALRAADPHSRTVLAGLPNESWTALRAIYRAGGRGAFDVVALHPYTGKPRNVLKLVRYARREMRRAHDGGRAVWITELSWPAAQGKTKTTAGFETTDGGQARKLGDALRRLAAARRALHIERVYWYTWLSREGSPNSFDYSGLRRIRAGREIDAPALGVFQRMARTLEGCAKAAGDAARCA